MGLATREAYGEALGRLIVENDKIVVLDADLTKSTKTNIAQKACPQRHLNMGIAECNMMSVAAGIASSGYTVFASTFAIFATGRAFEQIRNSIVYPNLNVKICGTHAGITVGEDGVSHQAIEDIAIMRAIPNMSVYCPCDEHETKLVINHISNNYGPCYVRLGRSSVDEVFVKNQNIDITKIQLLRKGIDVAIISTGLMTQKSLEAYEILKLQGYQVSVIHIGCIKPLDEQGLIEVLENHQYIITAEEHNVIGGLGSAIAEFSVKNCPRQIDMIGMQDCFGESGSANLLMEKYQLTAKDIVDRVLKQII